MKNKLLFCLLAVCSVFVSCDDKDDKYQDYVVATPLTMSLAEFKEDAIAVTDPVPIQVSGKIYAYGNYIFVNDVNRGFHVLDNTDATAPKNIAFIKLEGNYDISIKNNRLYADSYGDLVVMNISDIENINLITRLDNAIYDDYGYTSATYVDWPQADIYEYGAFDYATEAIIGWELRTEKRLISEYEKQFNDLAVNDTFSNGAESVATNGSTTGQGGSLARFKIVDEYLYAIDYNSINIFDISDLNDPQTLEKVWANGTIETIFNQGDLLFLGGTQGMYIYDISSPSKPEFVSEFEHGTACDPVVVDGDHAYVTLRGGNGCGATESGLFIVDISNIANPKLKISYAMDGPYGLGIKDEKLFVCDGESGLKVYDKTDVMDLVSLNHFANINTFDVIPLEESLLMVGDQVLYQYKYLDNDIELMSTLNLN